MKNRLITLCCAALIGFANTVQAGDLQQTMKEMKRAYRGAMSASSTTEMASYVATLKERSTSASRMSVDGSSSDQATFRQGMQDLAGSYNDLDRAIQSGNVDAAKSILQKIQDTQKQYHRKLGV